MGARRPRTQRRADARATRKLIHDRERLWAMSAGGSAERPIVVPSPAVIEPRVASLRCPQCDSAYSLKEHAAQGGDRVVSVVCTLCHAPRKIWFRLGSVEPN